MLRSSPTLLFLLLLSFAGFSLSGCGSDSPAGGSGHGGATAGHGGTGGAAGKGGNSGTGGDTSATGGATGGVSGTGGASGGASGTGAAGDGASGAGGTPRTSGGGTGGGGASGSGGTSAAGAGGGGTAGGGASGSGGTSAAGAGGGGTAGGGASGSGGTSAAGAGGGGTAGGGASGSGGTSACGPCNTPPTACHALTGTCVGGRCEYAFIDGADCDDGNACTINDTCTTGACKGTPMACTTPRAPICLDATHLQTYDNPGVCNGGRCVYMQEMVTCGIGGCANNACQTDPCASVTCSTPPSVCYDAGGTCNNGSCSYPPNTAACNDGDACTDGDTCSGGVCAGVPKLCNTPAADTCRDASTATVHDRVGKCTTGTCSYAVHYVSCPAGCANGVCNPSGWTSMVSNSNQSLYSVWGTSPSSVWAVGNGGTALYYNGIQWQSRPTPQLVQGDILRSLSGTSDSNIFAVGVANGLNSQASGTRVLRFDGTSWSVLANLSIAGPGDANCVAAYADNDAFVWGVMYGAPDESAALYRVTNGVATLVMTVPASSFSNQSQCGIQVFSLNNIVATTNSQVLRIDSVAHTATPIGGSFVLQNGILWANNPNDLFVVLGANALRWTGGATWNNLSTGLSGQLAGISGTSGSRVFAPGQTNVAGMTVGTVLFWDGVGWTVQTLPAATPSLNAVWASPLPEGRVFAVGSKGAIVTGP